MKKHLIEAKRILKEGIKKASVEVYKRNKLSVKVQKAFGFKIIEYNKEKRQYRLEKVLK